MHRTRLIVGLLAVAVALLAMGCGDDDAPSENGQTESRSTDADGAATAPAGASFPIEGRWRGKLDQSGLGSFSVTADIRSLDDEARNTVAYSKIDCGGRWTYLGRPDGAFRFRERIDRGSGGTCKGVGLVTLVPLDDDRLRYEFRGGGVESRGLLTRVAG